MYIQQIDQSLIDLLEYSTGIVLAISQKFDEEETEETTEGWHNELRSDYYASCL